MADIVEGIVISFSTRGGGQIAASEAALSKLGTAATGAATKGAMMGGIYAKAFEKIAAGALAAVNSMAGMVQGGIQFNAKLETSKMSMAGLLYSFSDVKDKTEKWNASLNDAVALQAKLKQMALETAGTYEDLVDIVKLGLAPGINAGLDPGQVAEIGLMVSQANAAIGQGSHMAMQEMRAIMTGNIDRNAQVAKTLEISSADVKKWKEAGTLAEELKKKFEGLQTAAMKSASTWAVLGSNMSDLMQQIGGEATEGAFESLKASLVTFTEGLVTVGKDGKRVFNEDLISTIRTFADFVATTFAAVGPIIISMLPIFSAFAKTVVAEFSVVGMAVGAVVAVLASAAKGIAEKILYPALDFIGEMLHEAKAQWPTIFSAIGGDTQLTAIEAMKSGLTSVGTALGEVSADAVTATGKFKDMFMAQMTVQKEAAKTTAAITGKYKGKGDGDGDDAAAKQIAKAAKEFEALKKAQATYITGIQREIQLREAVSDNMRDQLAIQHEMEDAGKKVREEIEKLTKMSMMPGIKTTDILKQLDAVTKAYKAKMEDLKKQLDEVIGAGAGGGTIRLMVDSGLKALTLSVAKSNAESALRFEKAAEMFQSSTLAMSDALVAGITQGFDAAVAVLERWASGNFTKLIDGMMTKFATGVFGEMGTDANGNPTVRDSKTGQVTQVTQAQMDKMNKATTAVAGIAAAYNLYQQRESVSKSQLAKQGAVTGMQIGSAFGPIGAVIGGVIGYVAGRMFSKEVQKQSVNLWVSPNPKGTTAGFSGQSGQHSNTVTDAEAKALAERAGTQYRKFWDIYAMIIMAIPDAIMPRLTGSKPMQIIGKNFAADFENWLNHTLPEEVAEKFKKNIGLALHNAFDVTAERFEELWKMTQNLDPGQAAQFWASFIGGLVAFERAATNMKGAQTLLNNPNGTWDATRGEVVEGGYASAFMLELEAAAQNVFKLARAVVNLTGEEQVKAFEQMGMSIEQITAGLLNFIANINAIKKALGEMFEDARLQKQLEHTDDPNEKARILEARYNQIMYQIQNAARLGLSPDEVAQLTQQGLGLLDQIYSLDPSKEAYAWWLEQTKILEAMANESLDQLGQMAIDAVGRLIEQLQPFVDWFKGAPVDIQAALDLLEEGFAGFGDALADLIDRINGQAVTPPPGTGGRPGGGIPGGPTDPDRPGGGRTQEENLRTSGYEGVTIPITIEGNVYGVEDLRTAIETAFYDVTRRESAGY